nr:molybdenum cofactor guanylyltransferase [Sulfobacillus harzensis]
MAGGMSRRMQQPKEKLCLPNNTTLLENAARVLEKTVAGTVWVSRPYGAETANPCHVPDRVPQKGPLAGLREGLARTEKEALAVLAVDLPKVPPELFRQLWRAWQEHPDADLVYPVAQSVAQPLAAIWHRRALPVIAQALALNRVPRLMEVVARLSSHTVAVDPDWLVNVNTPKDLNDFLLGWKQ